MGQPEREVLKNDDAASLDRIIEIRGYTEYSINGVKFCSHPFYQSEGPWYDWCRTIYADDNNNDQLGLVKMLCYLEFVTDKVRKGQKKPSSIILGHYCADRSQKDCALDTLLQT